MADNTQDKDELLILCVQKCPHLYDKKNENYEHEKLKVSSWRRIAKQLHRDGIYANTYLYTYCTMISI